MLASRATSRDVQRIARSFSIVVDTTGVKVAAVDHNHPVLVSRCVVLRLSRDVAEPTSFLVRLLVVEPSTAYLLYRCIPHLPTRFSFLGA